MKSIKPDNLKEILDNFSKLRIVVLGDIILDEYLWGKVQRISPEAPVPILEIAREDHRLGGAANAALNLAAMGANVELVGVCGKDSQAVIVRKLMKQKKMPTNGIFTDVERPTTLKTRIGAASQQIVRMDRELCSEIRCDLREDIEDYLERLMPTCDALIIEDYNKGLLSRKLINSALHSARKNKLLVAVDPKKENFGWYQGVELFKPNFRELQSHLKLSLAEETVFFKAAANFRESQKLTHLVVTHGSEGMYVFSEKTEPRHLPSFAREVYDVSGAGDTVICALTLAYLYNRDIASAVLIANHAAAVVVAKHGTSSTTAKEIWDSFDDKQ